MDPFEEEEGQVVAHGVMFGWMCPKCTFVFSPFYPECSYCNASEPNEEDS